MKLCKLLLMLASNLLRIDRAYREMRHVGTAYKEIENGAGIIYNREFARILTETPSYYIKALFEMNIG